MLSLLLIKLAAPPMVDYGREVRPILSENCFYCHGQDPNQRKADLRLDTAAGQATVIVAGKPEASELITRLFSTDGDQMPPKKSHRVVSDAQKQLLKRWVAEGAKFEPHWAFVAPKKPTVPGSGHPIDAFLRAKMGELRPSPAAEKSTLLRRVSLDLTGLPPTIAEIDAFLKDGDYEKVLDRLFASPHYGERMALPWLDAARYADSNGFQQDGDTFQWLWRDWVVKALNANMPFDQFTIEQLAGDLLPNATLEQKIATGFNRNHLINGEGGAIAEEQRFNILFDRVDVTATNWLGLTMACSQCHDHKYDPITQADYYSLMAAFNNVSESGVPSRQSSAKRVSPPFVEVTTPEQKAKAASLDKIAASLKTAIDEKRKVWAGKPEEFDKAEAVLIGMQKKAEDAAKEFKAELPKAMVMADDKPRETHILDRGEYLKKKEKVSFAVPAFLPPLPKGVPPNRLGLAQWLVAKEHPLTARVAVNRAWQTFFGTGLVKTSEDFGVQSEVPLHGELLDWLAVEFRESGWDVKKLHRLIVTSDAYKQSSKVTPEHWKHDPENRMLARFPRVRLPAMILRDVALASSGLLNTDVGGRPVYPYQPNGVWDSLAITKERDFTYPASHGKDLYRRSLYTFWRRTVGPANMFDASNRQACKVRMSSTNTPLHALTTLNDPTWVEAARVLAEGNDIPTAFRKVLGRMPTAKEQDVLDEMRKKQQAAYEADPAAATKVLTVGESKAKSLNAELAAKTAVCLAILNLDEALTRE